MKSELADITNEEFRRMLAERIAVLANPTRIHLIHFLMQEELSVHELAERVHKSQATVSNHLTNLYRHGYVSQRKEGVKTYYTASDDGLREFCAYMCNALKEHLNHMADVGGRLV
jgi:ArsR family transcriptional regulator